MKITASCLWTWFADIRLRFQQTKHLQCNPMLSFTIFTFYTFSDCLMYLKFENCVFKFVKFCYQVFWKLAILGFFFWGQKQNACTQKEPKIAKFSKTCQICADFGFQLWNYDFWWWLHILNFKYVWNLPTLSLA